MFRAHCSVKGCRLTWVCWVLAATRSPRRKRACCTPSKFGHLLCRHTVLERAAWSCSKSGAQSTCLAVCVQCAALLGCFFFGSYSQQSQSSILPNISHQASQSHAHLKLKRLQSPCATPPRLEGAGAHAVFCSLQAGESPGLGVADAGRVHSNMICFQSAFWDGQSVQKRRLIGRGPLAFVSLYASWLTVQ